MIRKNTKLALVLCAALALGGGFAAQAQEVADPFAGIDDGAPAAVSTPAQPVQPVQDAPAVPPASVEADAAVDVPQTAESDTGELVRLAPPGSFDPPPLPPGVSDGGPELFYDADNIVPRGEMGTRTGLRMMNPLTQPASRFLIVREREGTESVEAQLVAAQRAKMLGRHESAVDIYDDLYRENARDPRVLMGRAVAYQHLGHFDTAIQVYQELLDLKPDNLEAQVNMLGLMAEKYPSVALRRLLDLHHDHPQDIGVIAQIAVTNAKLGSLDEALRYLGRAAAMEPRNAGHVFNMAVVADRMGDTSQAMIYYEDALEIDTLSGGGESVPRNVIYERLAQLRS